jgi:hypothetical protein
MNSSGLVAVDAVTVNIGGVPIVFVSDNPHFHADIVERYPGFVRTADPGAGQVPLVRFEVEILPDGELSADEDVRVWKELDRWSGRRGDFRAQFDLERGRGTIQQELNPYALNSILRIVHSIYLVQQGGFLLHAASAVRNGCAFVFSGLSGAGKTTISRCAPEDAVLLTDEISFVRPQGLRYHAWGTPFAGDLGRAGANVNAPITTLFFLEKGAANFVENIDKAQALRLLLRNILFFCEDAEMIGKAFAAACAFIDRVPVRRLTFVPGVEVWNFLGGSENHG